jgi:hypothetical protein
VAGRAGASLARCFQRFNWSNRLAHTTVKTLQRLILFQVALLG